MVQPPSCFATLSLSVAPLLFQRGWRPAEVRLRGALLTPGPGTVMRQLRITGWAPERPVVTCPRVLNRAIWRPPAAARLRLPWRLAALVPPGPVGLGLDDTIGRRRGACIAAQGISRDPVRSSQGHCVKARGLRWLSLRLLAPLPWARRIWAKLAKVPAAQRLECQMRGGPF